MQTPTDFLAVYSMAIIDSNSDQYFLLNKDVNFIREGMVGTILRNQKYYALFDHNTFILGSHA